MTDREKLLFRLQSADRSSKSSASRFSEIPLQETEEFISELRKYTAEKFLMTGLPEDSDNLYDLGKRSFVKLQEMKDAGLLGDEINTGCSGASSDTARKALFFMAL